MERRGYLALVGSSITVGLAGCGGTDQPDDETTTAPGGTQPGGDTVGSDETTAPEGGEATTTAETTTEEPTTEPQTTETQTTATEPTTAAPGDVSTVVIEGSIFAGGGPGAGPGKHVEVTITNEGDAASGEVTITVEWYDENGTLVATSNETAPRLGPRETAVQAVSPDVEGAAAEAIADFDVSLDATGR
jgi:hypothetical protein